MNGLSCVHTPRNLVIINILRPGWGKWIPANGSGRLIYCQFLLHCKHELLSEEAPHINVNWWWPQEEFLLISSAPMLAVTMAGSHLDTGHVPGPRVLSLMPLLSSWTTHRPQDTWTWLKAKFLFKCLNINCIEAFYHLCFTTLRSNNQRRRLSQLWSSFYSEHSEKSPNKTLQRITLIWMVDWTMFVCTEKLFPVQMLKPPAIH